MRRVAIGILLSVLFCAPAFAQRAPVVVELFTSQGCSSCPPADALMHDLAARPDVIAIALHVDYWDYIGWKDEFADPAHAERQRGYARVADRRAVYTPEFIVNGTTEVVGAKPMSLANAISQHQQRDSFLDLSVTRDDGVVVVSAPRLAGLARPLEIHLLRYQKAREARITRGENAGRDFVYANVAEDWRVVGTWDGRTPLRLAVEAAGPLPVVVLLQEEDHGAILSAARID
jgi:hypothetical protein